MLRGRRRQVASPSLESSSRGSSWVTLSLDHGPSAAADDAPPNPPRKHRLWSVSHSCGRATASMDEDSDDSDSEKHFCRNKRATAKDKEDAMTSMPALEAYCKGSWWDASILKQRGEEFRVRYEKFKSADNEWLPQGHLRMRSRMAYPSDCKQVLSRGNDVCVFAHHPDGRNRHAAWYDAKILRMTPRLHMRQKCRCTYYVQLYQIPKKLPFDHEQRLLLEGFILQVDLAKMSIMQKALNNMPFSQILMSALPCNEKAAKRKWAVDGTVWYTEKENKELDFFTKSQVAGGDQWTSAAVRNSNPISLLSFDDFLEDVGIEKLLSDEPSSSPVQEQSSELELERSTLPIFSFSSPDLNVEKQETEPQIDHGGSRNQPILIDDGDDDGGGGADLDGCRGNGYTVSCQLGETVVASEPVNVVGQRIGYRLRRGICGSVAAAAASSGNGQVNGSNDRVVVSGRSANAGADRFGDVASNEMELDGGSNGNRASSAIRGGEVAVKSRRKGCSNELPNACCGGGQGGTWQYTSGGVVAAPAKSATGLSNVITNGCWKNNHSIRATTIADESENECIHDLGGDGSSNRVSRGTTRGGTVVPGESRSGSSCKDHSKNKATNRDMIAHSNCMESPKATEGNPCDNSGIKVSREVRNRNMGSEVVGDRVREVTQNDNSEHGRSGNDLYSTPSVVVYREDEEQEIDRKTAVTDHFDLVTSCDSSDSDDYRERSTRKELYARKSCHLRPLLRKNFKRRRACNNGSSAGTHLQVKTTKVKKRKPRILAESVPNDDDDGDCMEDADFSALWEHPKEEINASMCDPLQHAKVKPANPSLAVAAAPDDDVDDYDSEDAELAAFLECSIAEEIDATMCNPPPPQQLMNNVKPSDPLLAKPAPADDADSTEDAHLAAFLEDLIGEEVDTPQCNLPERCTKVDPAAKVKSLKRFQKANSRGEHLFRRKKLKHKDVVVKKLVPKTMKTIILDNEKFVCVYKEEVLNSMLEQADIVKDDDPPVSLGMMGLEHFAEDLEDLLVTECARDKDQTRLRTKGGVFPQVVMFVDTGSRGDSQILTGWSLESQGIAQENRKRRQFEGVAPRSKKQQATKEVTYIDLFKTIPEDNVDDDNVNVPQSPERCCLLPGWNPLMEQWGPESTVMPATKAEDARVQDAWEDMRMALESEAMEVRSKGGGVQSGKKEQQQEGPIDCVTKCRNPDGSESDAKHVFLFDHESGLVCQVCGLLGLKIANMLERDMPQRLTIARDARDDSEVDGSDLDNLDTFHGWDSDTDELGDCRDRHGPGMTETSLFDAIPELEKYMQKHQKEGFQFLWRNLAGLGPGGLMTEIGGCVLSHAPGTGKTFLIISFLQSYMSANPNCRPLIIAPKIMLQPWEQEFRKWNVDIPVYILNRASEYGRQLVKEHEKDGQLHLVGGTTRRKTDNSRLATLWEWRQNPSVLVVSYAMFTSLTDDANHSLERATIRQNLLEASNMLILDEGHFARNRKAKVRKALMLVKTKKRVLLSGTLFQNNFEELFTTLYLVRPRFVETFSELSGNDSIVQEIKAGIEDSGSDPLAGMDGATKVAEAIARRMFIDEVGNKIESGQRRNGSSESLARGLEQLQKLTSGFVHHYTGDVLRSLPPLRDFSILLQPTPLQDRMLQELALQLRHTVLEQETIMSLVCIHPFLFSGSKVSKIVSNILPPSDMEEVMTNKDPAAGVKTNFVLNLLRLLQTGTSSGSEKMLIFSQNLGPLLLLQEMFLTEFGWRKETDFLQLDGQLRLTDRLSIIERFNNPMSGVRVLLASTKACGEGITLTGASRVVFMDVLWNPAVIRQAISRAFRLGQKKIVYVYRLVVSGCYEERKYRKMVWKDWMSQAIFNSGESRGGGNQEGEAAVMEKAAAAAAAAATSSHEPPKKHCLWEVTGDSCKDVLLKELLRQDHLSTLQGFKRVFRHEGMFDNDYEQGNKGTDVSDWLRGDDGAGDSFDVELDDSGSDEDSMDGDNLEDDDDRVPLHQFLCSARDKALANPFLLGDDAPQPTRQ